MQRFYINSILSFFLLIGFTFTSLQAVNSFRPGFYLTNSGDSLRGYIKMGSQLSNETRCLFKADKKSEIKEFFPGKIAGYGLDQGKIFLSRTVPQDSMNAENQVFMELLQEGRLKLFRYQERFFLEYDAGKKFEELLSSSVIKNVGYRVFQESKNEYVEVIAEAMADCPRVSGPVKNGLRKLEMAERDLMKLMKDYHQCKQERLLQPDPRPRMRASFGSIVGGGETSIRFKENATYKRLLPQTNSEIYSLVNTQYSNSRSAVFGVYTNIAFPRGHTGLSFHAEFLYKPLQFRGENEFSVSQNQFNDPHDISDENEIRLHKIMIPLGIRKTFGTGVRPFYIGAGFSLQVNAGKHYIISREMIFPNSGTEILTTERIWSQNAFEVGIWAQAGMVLAKFDENQLSFELKVEQSGANTGFYDWHFGSSAENRYQLRTASFGFAYAFWAK